MLDCAISSMHIPQDVSTSSSCHLPLVDFITALVPQLFVSQFHVISPGPMGEICEQQLAEQKAASSASHPPPLVQSGRWSLAPHSRAERTIPWEVGRVGRRCAIENATAIKPAGWTELREQRCARNKHRDCLAYEEWDGKEEKTAIVLAPPADGVRFHTQIVGLSERRF